jgi:hypothetical protein
MSTQFDPGFFAVTVLSEGVAEAPIAVWTVDELDRFSDLDSVRVARLRTGDGSLWHAE